MSLRRRRAGGTEGVTFETRRFYPPRWIHTINTTVSSNCVRRVGNAIDRHTHETRMLDAAPRRADKQRLTSIVRHTLRVP